MAQHSVQMCIARITTLVPLLLLSARSSGLAQTDTLCDFFPLRIGNAWTYGVVWDTTYHQTATVFDTTRIANKLYYLYTGGPLDLIGNRRLAADTIRVDSVGRVWKYEDGLEWMLFQFSGDSFVSHTTYPDSAVVPVITGLKDTVPAGAFIDCVNLFFRRSFYDESVGYVFAPGVGIIEWYGPFYAKTVLLRAVIDGRLISAVNMYPSEIPKRYDLRQNFPNPFNPSTTIQYGLPRRSQVTLVVFNTLGQQVATLVRGDQEAGHHSVNFNASNLSSGVYFYRLTAGQFVETRKMIVLK